VRGVLTFPALFALAWQHQGHSLPEPEAHDSVCTLCGYRGEALRWETPPTWTAASTHAAPGSRWICHGCSLLTGRSPVTSKSGCRQIRWTMFSLAANPDRVWWWSKAEKPGIRAWLRKPPPPPRALLIADSGKKHWAHMTPVGWDETAVPVRFEDAIVIVEDAWWSLLADCDRLLAEGVSRRSMLDGTLSVFRWSCLSVESRAAWRRVRMDDVEPAARALAAWLAGHDRLEGGADE